ncbi:MAG: S8 family peptidase [Bacteroidetes bacterium]|nr:S8 family peptidase [Bacteroidota bacterium]
MNLFIQTFAGMLRSFLFVCCLSAVAIAAQSPAPVPESDHLSAITRMYLQSLDTRLFPEDSNGKIPAVLQLQNSTVPVPSAAGRGNRIGNLYTCRINRNNIYSLLAEPAVEYIDVYGRLNASRTQNDTARIHSHVNEAQAGLLNGLPDNYMGKGVIVGIIDIGFQSDNPTFFGTDGTTYRVKRWWHQSATPGPAPAGYSYGTEQTQSAAIQATQDEDGLHGTHVGGIAAGSGFSTPALKYRGMAPESDLVFVTIKYANDTLNGSAKGDHIVANPSILDGFRYVFDYATAQNKPAVCNLSWGMHTGPHDGTSLFDKAVEQLTGPGKIVVGANGNDAGNQMHCMADLNSDTAYTFIIDRNRKDYSKENVYCDMWGSPGKALGINLTLFDTLGAEILQIPFTYASSNKVVKGMKANGTDTLWYTFSCLGSYVNNGKPNILVMAESSNSAKLRIRMGITGEGTVHGWNSGQAYRWTSGSFLAKVLGNDHSGKYLDGTQAYTAGENGGTGKATISVGAYVNRNNWYDAGGTYRAQNWLVPGEVSGFSSRGPAADGRLKPDICAPGQLVGSSAHRRQYPGWLADLTTYKSTFQGNENYWVLLNGTSMAAPHVAGVVALVLQAAPKLNPEQVRLVLGLTATRDALTTADSNIHYGRGRVNAFEAVKLAVQLNKLQVQQPSKDASWVYPNPASGDLYIHTGTSQSGELALINPQGREVSRLPFAADATGMAKISVRNMAPGVYFYRLSNTQTISNGSIVIMP